MFYRQCNDCGVRKEFGEAWSCKCQPESKKGWVGLTDEDKHYLNEVLNLQGRFPVIDAIEAKLREKNHG